jgi:hypothetical protein
MVAAIRRSSPSDAALNLLWPGLAQLVQRRYGVAAFFAVEAAAACVLFIADPAQRPLAVAGIVGLTAWSMVDAWWAERRRDRGE